MKKENLINAFDVLDEVARNFEQMPEKKRHVLFAASNIRVTQTYLAELAEALEKDQDPYEAMLKAAVAVPAFWAELGDVHAAVQRSLQDDSAAT